MSDLALAAAAAQGWPCRAAWTRSAAPAARCFIASAGSARRTTIWPAAPAGSARRSMPARSGGGPSASPPRSASPAWQTPSSCPACAPCTRACDVKPSAAGLDVEPEPRSEQRRVQVAECQPFGRRAGVRVGQYRADADRGSARPPVYVAWLYQQVSAAVMAGRPAAGGVQKASRADQHAMRAAPRGRAQQRDQPPGDTSTRARPADGRVKGMISHHLPLADTDSSPDVRRSAVAGGAVAGWVSS